MPASQQAAESAVNRILSENVLTLQDARREIAGVTGKRPDKSTVFRWIHRGVAGVKLEHVRIGSQILTSRQAITRFIVARTAASR